MRFLRYTALDYSNDPSFQSPARLPNGPGLTRRYQVPLQGQSAQRTPTWSMVSTSL